MYKFLVTAFIACLFIQDEPTITWNLSNRLEWSDFQGAPKPHQDVVAVTASGLSFGYSTKRYNTGRIDYDFDVTAHFYPEKSWYVKEHVTNNTLNHERLHFDITELHARKFRQLVRSTEFSDNINQEMDAINVKINEQLRAMQKKYDAETDHSRLIEKQEEWQHFIVDELVKLKRFAN